jgi:hypothetical protein
MLRCSCIKNLSSFWLELKQQWTIEEIPIFSNSSHLESQTQFWKDPPRDHLCQVRFNLVQRFQRRRFKCESLRRTTDAKRWQRPGELKRALGGSFQNCVWLSRWLLLLKIGISSIVHCCFSSSQNELKFLMQLHSKE